MSEENNIINIRKKLQGIQSSLKAPKGQTNKFGGYSYRSAEDILNAVKPLLNEWNCTLVLNDDMVMVGDRHYIKSIATLADSDTDSFIHAQAFAREAVIKKGMDEAQITGSASSYARKYALNALFAIDDTKDPDATNTHGKEQAKKIPSQGF